MTYDELKTAVLQHCDGIQAAFAAFGNPVPPPPPEVVTRVMSGDALQPALDKGGIVALEGSGTWQGTFVMRRPGTVLRGNGAHLHSPTGPALLIPPGANTVAASALSCTSGNANASPVQIGTADSTQSKREDIPWGISLRQVSVPSHRGKRGFGLHGHDVVLEECSAEDVWITGTDSQPWWIHNTPGPIKILGGRWSAGAELGLFGGATAIIPGLVPTNVEVLGGYYYRPEAWQVDNIDQEVKCGLEVKNGQQITFRGMRIQGCWQDAQPLGAAFMLTPASGGLVRDISIEDVELVDCADGVSITGRDAAGINTVQTTGIRISKLRGRLKKNLAGGSGRGIGLLVQRGVGSVDVSQSQIDTDGPKILEIVDPTQSLVFVGNVARLGKYAMTFGGTHASITVDPFVVNVANLTVNGNIFGGLGATTRLLSRFPQNTLVTEAELVERFKGLQ